jgi:hypothetical protein
MVSDGTQLIVVSARTNPEPLVRCLLRHPKLRGQIELLADRNF